MVRLFGLSFHTYGLLIGLGIWLAYEVAVKVGKEFGVKKEIIEKVLLWTVIPSVIGARMYHVIDLWSEIYAQSLVSVFYVWEGGLGIWGAITGGLVGTALFYVLKRDKLNLDLLKILDVGIVGVPLAQAIGRWGNFFNGELYGKATSLPWGIKVAGLTTKVHPLFLYESIFDLLLFGVMVLIVWVSKDWKGIPPLRFTAVGMTKKLGLARLREYRPGSLLGTYLIGYGVIRFLLEPLRPEEVMWTLLGLPVAQIFSAVAIVGGVVLLQRSLQVRS